MKQTTNTKKLALAGVLTALAIVGSFLSFPIAGSKCAPVQHMVNIFAAVLLGPGWGVGACGRYLPTWLLSRTMPVIWS